MLNYLIEEGGKAHSLVVAGDLSTLLADVSTEISLIHENLRAQSPAIAELFRNTLIRAISDPKSPIWSSTHQGVGFCTITRKEKNHD